MTADRKSCVPVLIAAVATLLAIEAVAVSLIGPQRVNARQAAKAAPSMGHLSHLLGMTVDAVVDELGQPTTSDEFTLDHAVGELYGPLFNTYPPDDPATPMVKIRELRWRSQDVTTVVFFHEIDGGWVALDTVWWEDGIVF
ncbi:MAG: hypothetical protein GC159_03060 [Phycisphaera sp.]|nr:hypothetical protein [Phycisphaera sp.]